MFTPLEIKARAAAETFEKFNGKPFELGKNDCARMAAFHLKKCGHKLSLFSGGYYSTEVGARLALKKLGVSSLTELMDTQFQRHEAPIMAVAGDIVALKAEGETGDAMGVVLHRGHVLAFLHGVCAELKVSEYVASWKVL